MSDVDERVVWLTERLDELERVAQAAAEWHTDTEGRPFWPRGRVEATYIEAAKFGRPGSLSGLDLVRVCSPAIMLARVAADRRTLAEILSWTHLYLDDDTYYSCAQAASTWQEDRSPGSGCDDEERSGRPCDCGVDRRRGVILGALLSAYQHAPGFREEWLT